MFELLKKSKKSKARLGVLNTARGKVDTPFFMPIATKAAIKSMEASEVKNLGAQIILSNTYHNLLRPGLDVIKKFGGLHKFMDSDLPILTDSGGYQVFSLAKLRKIIGNDIKFQSHIDGSTHILNPRRVIDIQVVLGSDIMMVLDECVGLPTTWDKALEALERTSRWAQLAVDYKNKLNKKSTKIKKQLIFGIVQGADFKDLRLRSAKELVAMNFDGYAIGGLAVGETAKVMYQVLDYTVDQLPENKARYLMGVGYPENIIEAVKRGIDMFDCVIPTREARHGKLYIWRTQPNVSKKNFYTTININNAKFRKDKTPINNTTLKNYSRAYLHHLFKTGEPLSLKLATLNNLEFYLTLMAQIRQAIRANKL
ncbi:MAG: tRNA guanosine(34) transglycosylase Tgt [Candidatus Komeilibacteria bacterium RIFOXYC1_FULL_37_11]|uniref:Queuine tRNA-ribosyltransferase n=1 Tax=Candidatus Komeilibacteria bacterium RIFOXYC1_FULL_37_11 TaxID=1798555 RepID=A0A1G2BY23_9BACT|nr:MAG: tRNA guanosine(34) transglycosylase Tgt [Candidatus Komeilibacteria bacterium RIFOXYC1_FULL_37_11]OGY95265.1 MAG: tRNA guanosine(34) transglycosylase Tgt [Candidatus Komeilibacteria bacterium RIFOXYD1_FULL_37_29]OGY96512.1 MAG: tRNA guanosine(34) transglycosylase Tgt [Candidatus Komeilibacteria bacterium RIFOXYD2_FULL_37_8]